MECDLVEVSGQMALPLPLTQPLARLSRISLPRLFPRPPIPILVSFSGSPLDFHRRASKVRDGARMALARGVRPSTPGTATRAEGVTPDDRSLETAAHPLGNVLRGRRGRRDRDGLTLVPRSAEGVLKQARAAAAAGRFDDAVIYFKQALQFDAKSAAIHEEFANLYRDWAKAAPADRQETLRNERLDHLLKAVKFDKNAKGPKIQLLEAAMAQDNAAESVYWAREVLKVDPDNADAHYVLAFEELETRVAQRPRGQAASQGARRQEGPGHPAGPDPGPGWRRRPATTRGAMRPSSEARAIALPADADPIDRVARLRVQAIEIQNTADARNARGPGQEPPRGTSRSSTSSPDVAAGASDEAEPAARADPARARLAVAQGSRGGQGRRSMPWSRRSRSTWRRSSRRCSRAQKADLQVYLTYADHLRFRQQRDRCLKVIDEALALPAAVAAGERDLGDGPARRGGRDGPVEAG